MSDLFILISFAVAIGVLVLLIARFKVHPVFVLFAVVAALGLLFRQGGSGTPEMITEGFGNTMASVGLLIVFGCVLGRALELSGAALRISEAAERSLGTGKKIPWGIALASCVIGVPVIADTVVIMLIPIVSAMAMRTRESMMKLGPILYLGAYVMTSLVLPGPGPLAAAGALEVNLGQAILFGGLVGLFGVAVGTFYLTRITTYVAPKPEFVESIAATAEGGGTATAGQGDRAVGAFTGRPLNLGACLLPVFLPITLIMIDSVLGPLLAEGTMLAEFIGFVGSPVVALALGLISTLPLFGREWATKRVLNDMFEEGLRTAALPVILTGTGGALALLIRNTEVAERIAAGIEASGIPPLIVPFLVAAAINTITGSNILGMLTSAAIMAPLVDTLGVSALAVYLACGTGAQIFKHANSSGFWVTTTLSNMTVGQGIRSIGVATSLSGISGFLMVLALYYLGLI
ncbi:GntP family permease [Sediminivirga luteola]|uniref:Gluconate permease n=1 Tax=Sediminivirga luteola TaxID=1774748 RepID=A0A8J2TW54_9MICO|nr:GntP family permease [Sediminivirga luteola]MCI2265734.1 GntP family permease [Sediminivirga luteola]GGA07065.1 gluconate permease [Sediminivirga luteola]